MDELDQERSTAQALAAAGAAAALFAGLALAITRKRDSSRELVAALDGGADTVTADRVSDLAEQVAALAPEVMEVLDRQAPETARRLRDRLPMLRRVREDSADRVAEARCDVVVDAEGSPVADLASLAPQLDLAALTPAQAAAARAAAAAVARAEQALGAVGSAGSRSRGSGQEAAEEAAHALREVAQQAAEVALALWQNARGRVATAADDATDQVTAVADRAPGAAVAAREAVTEAVGRTQGVVHEVAEKAHGLGAKAHDLGETTHDLGEKAKRDAHDAVEATVKTGKESVSAFAWLVALVTLVVYVLLKPERRESLTRFADEAAVQVQELLRDLRGYDDEF